MNYRPSKYKIEIGAHTYDVEHIEPKAGEHTKYKTKLSVMTDKDLTSIEINMNGTATPCEVMERVCELHEFLTTKWT